VNRDLVSAESAERDYGVVIAGEAVDEQGTEELRTRLREERGEPAQFDYGVLPEGVTVG
jgi:N-methylhydantoinase B